MPVADQISFRAYKKLGRISKKWSKINISFFKNYRNKQEFINTAAHH